METNQKDKLYDLLVKQIQKRDRSCGIMVNNHLRIKTGIATLPAYHNSEDFSSQDKEQFYKAVLAAIYNRKLDELDGAEPNKGQVRPPEPDTEREPDRDPEPSTDSRTQEAPATQESNGKPTADQVLGMLRQVLSVQGEQTKVDPSFIEELIDRKIQNITLPPRDVVRIEQAGAPDKEMGTTHKQFGDILRITSSRGHDRYPMPLWIYGAPAGGKTTIGRQLAEALELEYYPVPMGPTTTEAKLLGYTSIATGKFIEGLAYKPFKDGGVCFWDEVDIADPGVLVAANSLIANDRYRFPNGEVVQKHSDFHLICAGNTVGKGATGGFARNRLDAATLDRFVKLRLDYDESLEEMMAQGESEWLEYVRRVRAHVEQNSHKTIYVTPRATAAGAAMLRNGLARKMVAETTLFAGMDQSVVGPIVAAVGKFE